MRRHPRQRSHAATALLVLFTASCAAEPTRVARTPAGYPAISFAEEVEVPQGAGRIRLRPETTLVGDHMTAEGDTAYCGTVILQAATGGRDFFFRCFRYTGDSLIALPPARQEATPVRAGTVIELRR